MPTLPFDQSQNVAMIVPVPGLPALGAYPGATRTTTIFAALPLTMLPDLTVSLATSVPMNAGRASVGGGLLPPDVDHGPPQAAGGVLVGSVAVPAKPLNA